MFDRLSEAEGNFLTGKLLIAMPSMQDPWFERSVVYLCAHSEEWAMGLVLNRLVESLSFPDLLAQLGIEDTASPPIQVHFGGPVETGRGFVLHSTEYLQDSSLQIDESVALTATVDILRDIAHGRGPRRHLLALGYAGWGPGQLDQEIQANGWLIVDPDETLLFDGDLQNKWQKAVDKIGLDLGKLSGVAGHA
ncbi:MAG: YqgE/AlgH family protein [Tistlia sp.]|uniref:YqgE/AlgH family protein n=1 Tax=Tistlia sp. TaxID=3057121 RepID=UPI0034A20AE0